MTKIRLLNEVNDLIFEAVQNFWEDISVDPSNLTIAADQIVMIYLYIVIRSKIPCFYSQIRFIQQFTTKQV